MTPRQQAELHDLARARDAAERVLRAFGYTNMAGQDQAALDDIARRGADLEVAVTEARSKYAAFIAYLGDEARAEAVARYSGEYGDSLK